VGNGKLFGTGPGLGFDPRDEITGRLFDPEVAKRASLLPMVRMNSGERAFGAPQFLVEMLNSAMLPGAAAQGYQATPQDAAQFGLDWMAGGMGVNALGKGAPRGAVLGANVWQGGPHKYGPKGAAESLQHVGKGEGAAAYGWGRYDAGAREVAEKYRKDLSGDFWTTPDGELFDPSTLEHLNARSAVQRNPDIESLLPKLKGIASKQAGTEAGDMMARDIAKLEALQKKGGLSEASGHIYKHDLPDEDIARYLDWDKPLSEQPESVKEALKELGPELQKVFDDYSDEYNLSLDFDSVGGEQFVQIVGRALQDDYLPINGPHVEKALEAGDLKKAASMWLRNEDIPGLKYLDGMSRGEGAGTHNYVTWDQDVLNRMKLLERNGATQFD